MNQSEFELAIGDYVIKKEDKENPILSHYVLKRQFRVQTYSVATGKCKAPPKTTKPSIPVVTPAGRFDSVNQAAEHYGVTTMAIYSRINKSRKLGNKLYYYDLNKDDNT